jgi:hypothetical protein
MQITLRKANALQAALRDHIETIKVRSGITLNEFQKVADVLADARNAANGGVSRRCVLLGVLYDIRTAIGRENAVSGIGDLLAKAAYTDKCIAEYKHMLESDKRDEMEVIVGRLEKIRSGESKSMYSSDDVRTGVFLEDDFEAFRTKLSDLRKEKQALNDQILELNIKRTIDLTDDQVECLQCEGLL